MKLRTILIVCIILLGLIGYAFAQGIGVPNIPEGFNVTLGTLPSPQPRQFIQNCQYDSRPAIKAAQVYSNELQSAGIGNITYEFQLQFPQCEQSYARSFTYPINSNPVTEIESDLRTTVINSINIPSRRTAVRNGRGN